MSEELTTTVGSTVSAARRKREYGKGYRAGRANKPFPGTDESSETIKGWAAGQAWFFKLQ